MVPMCRYLRKTVLMPLHSLSLVTFMFLCLSVIGTIISFFLLPLLPAIVLVQLCLIAWLLLHIRKPRDESGVSEQKGDLREKGQDIDRRLVQSTVVNLARITEFMTNLVNDEIDARRFRKQNPNTHFRVNKIIIFNGKMTVIVDTKKAQGLAKGMRFQVLQIDDGGIEQIIGIALISYIQQDRISHAWVTDSMEKHVWNSYRQKCKKTRMCFPRYKTSICMMPEESLSGFSLDELKGAKKLLHMMLF